MFKKTPEYKALVIAISSLLPNHYSFKEIADFFYRGGIIDSPKNPYGVYDGSKADYIKEKLAEVDDPSDFLKEILPEIFFDIDFGSDESETNQLVFRAKKFGYKVQTINDNEMKASYREIIPPKKLKSNDQITDEIKKNKIFPKEVNSLLKQLNDNLKNSNFDACALLIRRIIFLSSIIYLKKINRENTILDKNNDYKELSKILETVCQNIPDMNKILIAHLRTAKWMGDYANHNRSWYATESEIEEIKHTLLNFLNLMFPNNIEK